MGFAVLLNEMVDLPIDKVAPIIAQAENIIYADATRALRTPTGFLVKDLPRHEADSICNQLNNIGIGCFVMDMNRIYRPPNYYTINNAILQEDALFIGDYRGSMTALDWGNLVFISVGHILPHRKERYTLGSSSDTGIGAGISATASITMYSMTGIPYAPKQETQERKPKSTKAKHVLDMFLKAPNEAHLRIFSDGFNYGYLGPRIGMGSTQNFKLLVEDIVRFAPHAFGNRGVNVFLANGNPKDMQYKNMMVFDEENLWMLQIVYLNLNQQ